MIEILSRDRVTLLTLNRPDKRNALNVELCRQLGAAVTEAVADDARAIVITGSGTAFCSGADLGEVYTANFRAALYRMLHTIENAPVPVLAAVNGPAIGAGTQLAIAADFRIAGPGALFAVPTARLGLAVDPWTIRRLALLAGNGAARTLLLACDQLEAQAAVRSGFAERAGSLPEALEWAADIATLAPLTIAYSKQVLNQRDGAAVSEEELDAAFEECWASADFAEGRRARAEKRCPAFHGK